MTTTDTPIIQELLSLDHDLAKEVMALCQYKEYPSRSIISPSFFNNKTGIFLTSGVLKYTYITNSGDELIFHIAQAPAFLPYSLNGFFLDEESITSCVAVTPIKGYEIRSNQLCALISKNTQIYEFLFSTILLLYQAMQSKEISIIQNSSAQRYGDFVKQFSDVIEIIPLKDIASYLNIRPGSLSRIRKNNNT